MNGKPMSQQPYDPYLASLWNLALAENLRGWSQELLAEGDAELAEEVRNDAAALVAQSDQIMETSAAKRIKAIRSPMVRRVSLQLNERRRRRVSQCGRQVVVATSPTVQRGRSQSHGGRRRTTSGTRSRSRSSGKSGKPGSAKGDPDALKSWEWKPRVEARRRCGR